MPSNKRPRGLTPERQIIEFVICLVLTVLLFRTWQVENFVVPSGSMAGTLLGIHRAVECRACGYRFTCGSGAIDGFPVAEARAVCPNCDFSENPLGSLTDIAGDRLLVAKQAFRFRPPRRWEVAVFRRPDVANKVFVKRIAGLPGESIQIRDGDVYAGGEVQRKSLAEQRAVAIVVHDSQFPPSDIETAERWRGDASESLWRREHTGYFHPAEPAPRAVAPTDPDQLPVDWLTYRHLRRIPGQREGFAEAPIEDDYGYNQTRPIEEPAEVVDLMLSCRIRAFGRGNLLLFATDGREQFVVRIDPHGRQIALEHNGVQVAARVHDADAPQALFAGESLIELSLFDRQLLLALDGQLALPPYQIEPSDLPRAPTARPLAIGTRGLGLDVRALRVLRDTYYTHPRGIYSRWALEKPYQLAKDEYLMLGDNSPLSEDSRFWPAGPAVRASLLVGKPLVVHLPSRQADWGWGPFNVPDFSAMRYIR